MLGGTGASWPCCGHRSCSTTTGPVCSCGPTRNHIAAVCSASVLPPISACCAFFKYTNFFLENLDLLLGRDFSALHIILPLGISFITFQKIAYLVDVWRDRPPPYRLIDYALF